MESCFLRFFMLFDSNTCLVMESNVRVSHVIVEDKLDISLYSCVCEVSNEWSSLSSRFIVMKLPLVLFC